MLSQLEEVSLSSPLPGENEYESLRKEILQNDDQIMKIFQQIILLTTGIMGFGLSDSAFNPDKMRFMFFFISIIVNISGIQITKSRLKNIFRNASYIKIFLEPVMLKNKWETRLDKLRGCPKPHESKLKKFFNEFLSNISFFYLLFIFVNFILGAYYFYIGYTGILLIQTIIAIIATAFILISVITFLNWCDLADLYKRRAEVYDDQWRNVADAEKKEDPSDDKK